MKQRDAFPNRQTNKGIPFLSTRQHIIIFGLEDRIPNSSRCPSGLLFSNKTSQADKQSQASPPLGVERQKANGTREVRWREIGLREASRGGLPRAEDTPRGASDPSPNHRDGQGSYNERACRQGEGWAQCQCGGCGAQAERAKRRPMTGPPSQAVKTCALT